MAYKVEEAWVNEHNNFVAVKTNSGAYNYYMSVNVIADGEPIRNHELVTLALTRFALEIMEAKQ